MFTTSETCLFDHWKATSAPVFHSSKLWPAFGDAETRAFLSGNQDYPTPSRLLNLEDINLYKAKITTFLDSIRDAPAGRVPCQSAYQAFERERLTLLESMTETDPAVLERYNDELYGRLSDLEYERIIPMLHHHLHGIKPGSPAVEQARATLLELWHDVPSRSDIEREERSFNTHIKQLRPFVEHKYGFVEDLLAPHLPADTVPAEVVQEVLAASIGRVLGADDTGWTAAVKDGAPNVFIDHAARTIVIPAGRHFSLDHVRTLIIHEIGVHVARAINGERSRERLAAFGMAGYGPIEEAFGVFLENVPTSHYSPIFSLASFAVIDFTRRLQHPTFRQIYELNYAIVLCLLNPDAPTFDAQNFNYQRRAFSRTVRALRLGTGVLVDRSMTKYWRGELLLCRYLDAHPLTQTSFDEFFLGKYDCQAPEQLELVKHHRLTAA